MSGAHRHSIDAVDAGRGRAPARGAAWIAALGSVALGAITLPGCVTTTTSNDGQSPAPQPVAGPETPDAAPANAVVLITRPAVDTNGNLFRDRIELTAYLFAQPYPAPVFREGTLEFQIYPVGRAGTPDKRPKALRTWTIDAQNLDGLRSMSLPGPCYQLALSLLADGGTDRIALDAVDLVACFTAPGAPPVWAQNVTTIQLGTINGDSSGASSGRSSN